MKKIIALLIILMAGCMPVKENPIPPDLGESFAVKFQPMQCQTMAWREWYEGGGLAFVPTEEELIVAYYGDMGMELKNVHRVETRRMTCQACDVCPTGHYYTAEVKESQLQDIISSGWTNAQTASS